MNASTDDLESLESLESTVAAAIAEDLGDIDLTAQLIDEESVSQAEIITREQTIVCGIPWVNETFRQIEEKVQLQWLLKDGAQAEADQALCRLEGPSRGLLTGERTALNFLQTLSGTANKSHYYSQMIAHTDCKILDTRKTIPGLRSAQKYAVKCGGANNHRMGLYDAFLIKENHIHACGSISKAIAKARQLYPDRRVEIEVENLAEFHLAVDAEPDWIMLDNFSIEDMKTAASLLNKEIKLEASGGIESEQELLRIAETGVHFISIGALTKHVQAVDLSMRFI